MTRALLLVALGCLTAGAALAGPVELHYFWAATCPDCQVMREYLRALAAEFPALKIVEHEVGFDGDNFRLMAAVAEAYGLDRFATPVVAVGGLATTGIGRAVELKLHEEVARCVVEGCPSPLERLPAAPRWRLSPIELALVLAVGAAVILLLSALVAR